MQSAGFRRKDRPAKPDRSAEFASFELAPARARMATVADLQREAVVASATVDSGARRPAPTADERKHMARVKALACVLCRRLGQQQDGITEVHHLREEQGGAQRASNWLVASLCGEGCHRGPHGIHGDRARLRQAKCTEIDLLAWTLADLAREGTQ